MNARWDGQALVEPVSADEPCGRNLEDTDTLAAFDAFELFGQSTLDIEKDQNGKEIKRKNRPPDWTEIRGRSLDALKGSRDLRLLAHLGTALLRTDGLPAFVETLDVASQWLERYWSHVYPLLDADDAIFRRNALNCFADPVAVVDGLRRAAIVSSRQHGRFSLRDLDLAAGLLTPGQAEEKPDAAQITAAFGATPIDDLRALSQAVVRGLTALDGIDAIMRREAGVEAAPSFEPLSTQFKKMDAALRAQLARHPDGSPAESAADAEPASGGGGGAVMAVGAIKSRQDAIRALDAAAEFFRRNEPSSPIPMFLDRAKRLVSKDFLEVLADVAPDALPQARSAGGLRDE
jgi:type VI secretion system protein ImpA